MKLTKTIKTILLALMGFSLGVSWQGDYNFPQIIAVIAGIIIVLILDTPKSKKIDEEAVWKNAPTLKEEK